MTTKKAKNENTDEAILALAKSRFKQASEAETENRTHALDDLRFRAGEQWPDEVKKARDQDRRPCLTINRIPQFIRQITNDQRQNRPSIKVNPVDDKADIETAKVLQGLIRHIEYNSNADVAYDLAFESAVTSGLGYFRIITDYVDAKSFEQEILVKSIINPNTVYMDPSYTEPDASDACFCFVAEDLTREDYEAQYPESKMASMEDWRSIGDSSSDWVTKDSARVCEYFYKELEAVTIVQLSDNSVFKKSDLPEFLPEGITVLNERETSIPKIKHCKLNGIEVLEKRDWPGDWIPIIPVLGDRLNIDGKIVLEGIVRHAKDPQRMYNYWATSETEVIALAPRAPFIGVEGQFEGHEAQWKTANVKNHAFLEYKAKTIGGQLVGPPQRNVYEPPVQAITQARMQSSEDLKATTGIYDAALGARSNESSGVAIQRRSAQSQTANFHYVDNLSRALRHAGRIIVNLIPITYDTARAQRIIGDDGEQEIVMINQIFEQGGQEKAHQLGYGKYDVAISNGPSYATKRQEALESMLSLTKAYPQVAQVAADLMIKNMDWPGAQEIAERVKKTLPPGIADDPKDKSKPQVPPEMQAQMGKMDQMIQGLTEKLNAAQDKLESKSIELESRERIEFAKIEAAMRMKLLELDAGDSRLAFQAEIDQIDRITNLNQKIEAPGEEIAKEPQEEMNPTGGLSPGEPMEF